MLDDFLIHDHILERYTGTDTDVQIPRGVTAIGERAFAHCETMRSVTIPDTVASIGTGAFAFCKNLRSISLPRLLHPLGTAVFLRQYRTELVVQMRSQIFRQIV